MSRILESLINNGNKSPAKSYLIGFEQGKNWATNHADYFEIRQWYELEIEELEDIRLPKREDIFFRVLSNETKVEWKEYVRGWIDGVNEIYKEQDYK
ncbi:hypothetical protein KKF81_06310 [Candidatus Micrarchaeota archaeon]|nr:hypothetical protein [Candidatus Micrarchaeota archaeon]MBU1166542.1 hypothetical protein [Candidatus Micrarchaeota archaeon]MBU1887554.1 hypothetical protein [Candidatus Micrarchaeota archaeon]